MIAPEWTPTLILRTGAVLEPALIDGTYDWDITRKVVSGGSLVIGEDPGSLIGARLGLTVQADGDLEPASMGNFTVTSQKARYTAKDDTYTLDWMDDAIRLDRMRLISPLGLPATAPAIATARERLAAVNIPAALADSDRTLRTGIAWTADQNQLDVINKLLGVAGFHPLWPSPMGLFSRRAPDPDTAQPVWRFVEGEESLHLPEYPQEQDFLAVPNRLLGTTNGDDASEPLRAVARDFSRTQWGYDYRGDWVDGEPYTSDVTTQQALVEDTERKLREMQLNAVTMTIQHMWDRRVIPGSVGEVVSSNPEVAGFWQATSASTALVGSDALVSTGLRKVRS